MRMNIHINYYIIIIEEEIIKKSIRLTIEKKREHN